MDIVDDKISTIMQQLLIVAATTLENNKSCFVAQWLLQNPNEQVKEWVMCQQTDWAEHRYWMEKK